MAKKLVEEVVGLVDEADEDVGYYFRGGISKNSS
jgi:hypothetical protein